MHSTAGKKTEGEKHLSNDSETVMNDSKKVEGRWPPLWRYSILLGARFISCTLIQSRPCDRTQQPAEHLCRQRREHAHLFHPGVTAIKAYRKAALTCQGWGFHIIPGKRSAGAQRRLVARRFPAAALEGCGFKTGCHETSQYVKQSPSFKNEAKRVSAMMGNDGQCRDFARFERDMHGSVMESDIFPIHDDDTSQMRVSLIKATFWAHPVVSKQVELTALTGIIWHWPVSPTHWLINRESS